MWAAVLVTTALAVLALFRLVTTGESEDPSLEAPVERTTTPVDDATAPAGEETAPPEDTTP